MKTSWNTSSIIFLLLFTCFIFIFQSFENAKLNKHIKELRFIVFQSNRFQEKINFKTQSSIEELRLIFNQKFLQKMMTDTPNIRSLEYKKTSEPEMARFEI